MARGDEAACAVLVRRHQRRVYGIALAITGDRGVAEDVAQEAFLRAWRHAGRFDAGRAAVGTWLSTITRNLAIDALRVRRADPVGPEDPVWRAAVGDPETTESRALGSELAGRVRAALHRLPDEQRRVLVRSAFFGQSAAAIAEAESIPIGTAKSRIRLGLAKVRAAMGPLDP